MVLEANVPPFLEALVTFLGLEHLAEDVGERADRVGVDPGEHQFGVKAVLVGLCYSQEKRGRHCGRGAGSTE